MDATFRRNIKSLRTCVWGFVGLFVVTAAWNCKRTVPSTANPAVTADPDNAPPTVPFQLRRNSTDVLFFWFDERGTPHNVNNIDQIPANRRERVRVDPTQPELRAPGWIYVADLRAEDANGMYPVQAVQSEQFASSLALNSGLAEAMGAPPDPPAGQPPQPSVLRPSTEQPRVILYGASWCSACHQTAEWLRANRIPFVEHDIEQEPQVAQAMVRRAAAQGISTSSIPIVEVGGRFMVGFNPQAILQALHQS